MEADTAITINLSIVTLDRWSVVQQRRSCFYAELIFIYHLIFKNPHQISQQSLAMRRLGALSTCDAPFCHADSLRYSPIQNVLMCCRPERFNLQCLYTLKIPWKVRDERVVALDNRNDAALITHGACFNMICWQTNKVAANINVSSLPLWAGS